MTTVKAALAGNNIPAYAKTAGRAVHVKIYPQPQDVAESREVLRVLQRYGEVIMYKHLKVRVIRRVRSSDILLSSSSIFTDSLIRP